MRSNVAASNFILDGSCCFSLPTVGEAVDEAESLEEEEEEEEEEANAHALAMRAGAVANAVAPKPSCDLAVPATTTFKRRKNNIAQERGWEREG